MIKSLEYYKSLANEKKYKSLAILLVDETIEDQSEILANIGETAKHILSILLLQEMLKNSDMVRVFKDMDFMDRNKLKSYIIDSSLALGDPYVMPMKSKIPVKLPNTEACYRLYQDKNTFINAEVNKATKKHTYRMNNYVENLNISTNNLINNGYFFSKFFITYKSYEITIDLQNKKYYTKKDNLSFFNIAFKNNNKYTDNKGIYGCKGFCKTLVISWNGDDGIFKTNIHFFTNPHIENGISLSIENLPLNAMGLCVNNYRPKLMKIPNIFTKKYNKIENKVHKSKNPYQQINIKPKHEKWVTKV